MLHSVVVVLLLFSSAVADCPKGSFYESYFNKCYQFISTPKSFLDAEQYCISLGGHLAEESNAFESSYISSIARGSNSETPDFWIGANLLRSPNWMWTSNAPLFYTNWASAQPDNSNSCAYVRGSDSTWVTRACYSLLPFVCTMSVNGAPSDICTTVAPLSTCPPCACTSSPRTSSTPRSPSSMCSDGYTLYSGNAVCYKYHSEYAIFSEANATCSQEGGMLVKILSKDVNDFLTGLPGFPCGGNSCPFIGLTCTGDSSPSCHWADGTPLGDYNNYEYVGTRPYVLITDQTPGNKWDGKWEQGNINQAFLCQKEMERDPK